MQGSTFLPTWSRMGCEGSQSPYGDNLAKATDMSDESFEQPIAPGVRNLTPRQRVCFYLFNSLANDLDRGTIEEQHTAAVLRLAADAVSRGYDGELVRAMREWAWEMGR